MDRFEEQLQQLASKRTLILKPRGVGWLIDLPQQDKLRCQLSIGPEALDWYVALLAPNGHEVWTDWMDYLGYDKNLTVEDLVRDKLDDLVWFIDTWLSATGLRVQQTSKLYGLIRNTFAEWRHDQKWERIELCPPYRIKK